MLYGLLSKHIADRFVVLIAAGFAFLLTYALLVRPFGFLPRDGGKFVTDAKGNKVEVNKASNGKVTGVGILMILVYVVSILLFIPITLAYDKCFVIMLALTVVMMITGYLDDAAKAPWGELIKGILDFVLAVIAAITFVIYNSTDVQLFSLHFHIPKVLYVILAVVLIWGSINVTNCSDGIDGLCGTVSIIELFAFSMIFGTQLAKFSVMSVIMSFVLVAYLAFNWTPSKVLMGDAGSRAIGFLIAILAMKSGHPFAFILLSLVFLFDGGLGLLKLAVLRVFKINLFKNVRFPFHDHMKKNLKINNVGIVVIFAVCEIVMVVITGVIVHVCG